MVKGQTLVRLRQNFLASIWARHGRDSFLFFPMLSTPYMICANEPLSKEISVYSFKSSCSIIVA